MSLLSDLLEDLEVVFLDGCYEPSERGAGYASCESSRQEAEQLLKCYTKKVKTMEISKILNLSYTGHVVNVAVGHTHMRQYLEGKLSTSVAYSYKSPTHLDVGTIVVVPVGPEGQLLVGMVIESGDEELLDIDYDNDFKWVAQALNLGEFDALTEQDNAFKATVKRAQRTALKDKLLSTLSLELNPPA